VETIGMFDAKTRFSEIVRRVKETGQAVTISNRGEAIVRIVPVEPVSPVKKMTHEEAVAAIEEMWKTLPPITHEEIRSAIEEGRR
jgi:prevent-host-death family protein